MNLLSIPSPAPGPVAVPMEPTEVLLWSWVLMILGAVLLAVCLQTLRTIREQKRGQK
jgi:hypothetical protein